ncbi:MAG: M23 family metallopeptidase [Ignavibacteriae bacterium]|nr:M23 family metallopeptidase [Ignavibacteriota bacterium]
MSLTGTRRRKKSRSYEILVIPQGDGAGTKSLKAGTNQFVLWGTLAFVAFFLIFLLLFRYTPLGTLAGVDRFGDDSRRQRDEATAARIESLAEEIGVLKSYNLQLRKALGERSGGEASQTESAEKKTEPVVTHADDQSQTTGENFSQPASTRPAMNTEGLKATFPLFNPVQGAVTQRFEPDTKHIGLDFAAKEGTPVFAAAQGYILFSGWTFEFGNMIILSHGSGYVTVYKHNSSLLKATGSMVRRGDLIALVGKTGSTSKGPHLHFEVWKDGVPQDPERFLLTGRES